MFKTYTAPQVGATSIDDEGSTWRVTSVEGAHINWKLFKESKLTKSTLRFNQSLQGGETSYYILFHEY
mgnify:CR=1 FL=1